MVVISAIGGSMGPTIPDGVTILVYGTESKTSYQTNGVIMRKLILVLALLFLTPNVYAATGFYAPMYLSVGKAKISDLKNKLSFAGVSAEYDVDEEFSNSDWALGVGLGYDFSVNHNTPIRLEADFITRAGSVVLSDDKTGSTREKYEFSGITTIMFNGFFDIPVSWRLKPYIGLGMGYGFAHATYEYSNLSLYPFYSQSISGKTRSFPGGFAMAFQIGGKIKVSDSWAIGIGYRGAVWDFEHTLFSYRALAFGTKGQITTNELLLSFTFIPPSY